GRLRAPACRPPPCRWRWCPTSRRRLPADRCSCCRRCRRRTRRSRSRKLPRRFEALDRVEAWAETLSPISIGRAATSNSCLLFAVRRTFTVDSFRGWFDIFDFNEEIRGSGYLDAPPRGRGELGGGTARRGTARCPLLQAAVDR